jgi:hypothetical protein
VSYQWVRIVFTVLFAANMIGSAAIIGKPRERLSPAVWALNTLIAGALIWALWSL